MKRSSSEPGETAGLGDVLEETSARGGGIPGWGAGIVGGILLLGGCASVAYGLYLAYDVYYKHGPAVVWQNLVPPVVLGALLLLVGALLLGNALTRKQRSIAIYEQGFILRGRRESSTVRWDDLASIRTAVTRRYFAGIKTGTRHTYLLVRHDGERLVLDDSLKDVEVFGEKIREKAVPLLYDRYAPAFLQGQELAFGPVQICKETGLMIRQKMLPWEMIQEAKVENGALSIAAKTGNKRLRGANIPVAEVPNVDILLAFIHQQIAREVTPDNTLTAGD